MMLSCPRVYFHLFALFIPACYANLWDVTKLIQEAKAVSSQYVSYVLPANNEAYFTNFTASAPVDFGTFDFIIAGGGTAAGVLAYRLIQAGFSVLVVEAGGEASDTSVILGFSSYLEGSDANWGFYTTPQVNGCLTSANRQCSYPSGKALGGTTGISDGVYARGSPQDYDNWAAMGNTGWAYKDVLPYFKKSENADFILNKDADCHGRNGPQGISFGPDTPGLTTQLLEGFKEIGLREVDYNGESQLGCSRIQLYLSNNIRSGSNYCFFRPIRDSPNLNISLNSLVTKVVMENKRAVGIEFVKDGQYYTANASNEVILSAGAIGSPQILMLSGIGPAAQLKKFGIEVIADLPVGQHFRDHAYLVGVSFPTKETYYNVSLDQAVDLWMHGQGPLIRDLEGVISFHDLDNDAQPDIDIVSYIVASRDPSGNFFINAVEVLIQILQPHFEGEVTLASGDPRDYPLINPNLLANDVDVELIYQGLQIILALNDTEAYRNISSGFMVAAHAACDETSERMTKDWWFCVIRAFTGPCWHSTGTTRMGTCTNDSVVDPDLKVHGIDRLRVVDAGVMPTLNSGHTNAPVVMIAEKISDVIIRDYS
ncbi:L-sorbose 1-dehydrogenase-like [Euwallacea fornicatus]|uniref:L-sorbose 1-dehydrogenase-like n=1 Tax=Euwallacea fornicatus TaxID=995702 RepID=UPI00338F00FE